MNNRNFDKLMQGQISELDGKKRLLLHCCCAPCSSACLERLKEHFEITVLFYNPNIEDGEYTVRKRELIRLIGETGVANFYDCDSIRDDFYAAVRGLEGEPEGGARCRECFNLRLKKTAEIAEKENFDFFTTTLTISPLKDAELINTLGESLQNKARWLYSDFKKRGGYKRSIELSREHNLYRQNYCGCIFSRRGR